MDINNLKDLENLVKLCRKQGIATITVGDITFSLSETPQKQKKQKKIKDPFEQALAEAQDLASKARLKYEMEQQNAAAVSALGIPTDAPSELDMLLWSAGNPGEGVA